MIYRWSGEYWYADRRSLWKRVRQWFIWVGGWEKANGQGWRLRIPHGKRWLWMSPTPVSVFGHRATLQNGWIDLRWFRGTRLVLHWRHGDRHAYISRNGTPYDAHCWLFGAPRRVKELAEAAKAERDKRLATPIRGAA